MKLTSGRLLGALFVVAAFALTAVFYDRLPQLVPTHWNLHGQADGFTPKPWGPFVTPLGMTAVFALFVAIPAMSPRGFRIAPFERVFEILLVSMLGFLFYLHTLVLLAGTGTRVDIGRSVMIGLGVLCAIIGNFMGKLTRNFFVGIRTPWTLASDEVWGRTHRLGGKLFVAGGLAMVVVGLLGGGPGWLLAIMLVVAAISVAYSYVVYRRVEGFRDDPV
jgi:uncharacterized membrane protein